MSSQCKAAVAPLPAGTAEAHLSWYSLYVQEPAQPDLIRAASHNLNYGLAGLRQQSCHLPAVSNKRHSSTGAQEFMPPLKRARSCQLDEDYMPIAPLHLGPSACKRPRRTCSRSFSIDDDFVKGTAPCPKAWISTRDFMEGKAWSCSTCM